jgi:hypothetical protein
LKTENQKLQSFVDNQKLQIDQLTALTATIQDKDA